jgi:hypothetical protein
MDSAAPKATIITKNPTVSAILSRTINFIMILRSGSWAVGIRVCQNAGESGNNLGFMRSDCRQTIRYNPAILKTHALEAFQGGSSL